MKIQLHMHTCRYSACSPTQPETMLEAAAAQGFDAVYITEHDAVWASRELEEIRKGFPGLSIFGGVELTVGACHLQVLGTSDPAYIGITDAREIISRARAEGRLTILAHPFRWEGSAEILAEGAVPDAMEMWSPNHGTQQADAAAALAEELGIRTVNAADAHTPEIVGTYWIETDRPLKEADDIRDIIVNGEYRCCSDEALLSPLRASGSVPI